MRELLEKQEAIERQRSLLDAMLEQGSGTQDEEVIRANIRLDQLIEEYIELENRKSLRNV